MTRRVLRLIGAIVLTAVGLVTPTLVATSVPASADSIVAGCTVVSNPTPAHFTSCPGTDFSGADLTGVDLSYANLVGAGFVSCFVEGMTNHCSAANLTDANLRNAHLSGAIFFTVGELLTPVTPNVHGTNFSGADLSRADLDTSVDFTGDNLSGANLSGDTMGDRFVGANLSGASLSGASMAYSFSSSISFPANLTGANLTGTVLVPSDQTVSATSQAGAVVTWPTPPGIPGATPGSCTPPSGTTFPLFSTTVTCQVLDHANDIATGTFQVTVAPTTQYFTRVIVPSGGAVLAGAPYLDAAAGDGPGVTKVVFEVSGGVLHNQVIATATPTLFGWLAQWNSTSVPNGTYSLQSVATDAVNNTDTSTPITITVNNQPPLTAVLLPSTGATVSGGTALLDASASSAFGVTKVVFEVTGGALHNQVVGTATPTIYGWLAQWNTTSAPNGSYSLQSVATDSVAQTTTSSPITVTVSNSPPTTTVLFPSSGGTQSGTAALLDASASPYVTSVSFELSGGTLSDKVIASGVPTLYGWLGQWNTTTVPNGTYTLRSVASYAGGVTATSPGVTLTVANPGLADLANSSFAVTTSPTAGGSGCSFFHVVFDATYPGNTAVGNVTLHIAGCATPSTYTGSFTITTGVGTLSGNATGSIITPEGTTLVEKYQITLSVNVATGSFAGTTGSVLFSTSSDTSVASVAVG